MAVMDDDEQAAYHPVARALALVKVSMTGTRRSEALRLVEVYRARVVDVSPDSLIIETTGSESKIASVVEGLHQYGVVESVHSSVVSMARGIRAAGAHASTTTDAR